MRTRIQSYSHPVITRGRSVLIGGVLAATLMSTGAANGQHLHENAPPAKLVQLVRSATRQFVDVNNATAAGYTPLFGCVSGRSGPRGNGCSLHQHGTGGGW